MVSWVMGPLWVSMRFTPWFGPLLAFLFTVLAVHGGTLLGITLGVVVGIPGIVIPIYGWAIAWRREWTTVASALLYAATILVIIVGFWRHLFGVT